MTINKIVWSMFAICLRISGKVPSLNILTALFLSFSHTYCVIVRLRFCKRWYSLGRWLGFSSFPLSPIILEEKLRCRFHGRFVRLECFFLWLPIQRLWLALDTFWQGLDRIRPLLYVSRLSMSNASTNLDKDMEFLCKYFWLWVSLR